MQTDVAESIDLAPWGTPRYPKRALVIQHETDVVVESSASGWRIHNRVKHPFRRMVVFSVAAVCLGAALLMGMRFLQLDSSTSWKLATGIALFTLVAGDGMAFLDYRSRRNLPDLVACTPGDRRILASIEPEIVGGRLEAVVCRTGRRTDAESSRGVKVVQVGVVATNGERKLVKALWTFERVLGEPLERRLRILLSDTGVRLVEVRGVPELMEREKV